MKIIELGKGSKIGKGGRVRNKESPDFVSYWDEVRFNELGEQDFIRSPNP